MLMNKFILAGILAFILLVPNIQALARCEGDTLINEINITKNESGTITEFVFTEPTSCTFGCEENLTKWGADCVEPPYIVTIQVIVGIVLLFGFLVWAGGRKG